MDAEKRLGVVQAWQDVTASRTFTTTYTNTTGRPIGLYIAGTILNASSAITLLVNGVEVSYSQGQATASVKYQLLGIVPNGATYQVTITGSATKSIWVELR